MPEIVNTWLNIKDSSCFLIPLKENRLFKEKITMYLACIAYIKVKCVTTISQRIGGYKELYG